MLTNERQYRITLKKAHRLKDAIQELDYRATLQKNAHPRMLKAERDALESLLDDLNIELDEYEQLKSEEVSTISIYSLGELAHGLIKARVAGNLSQRALAQRMGIKEQQIQRYEAEAYASASFRRLCQVARALDVRIEKVDLVIS